jgi:hypothetical protein
MAGRLKLGEILLKAGVLSKEQLNAALEDQRRYGGRLGTILLERRFITEKVYFKALSTQLRIPAVDFGQSSIPEAICRVVPRELAEKYVVFPVATRRTPSGNVLMLAMADPTNVEAQDEIRFLTGFKVEPLLGLESTIRVVIREFWYEQDGKGTYRYKPDVDLSSGAPEPVSQEMEVIHGEVRGPMAPEKEKAPATPAPRLQVEHERGEGTPQLTRELKALLKLLVRKGLISQQEYLDEFKET